MNVERKTVPMSDEATVPVMMFECSSSFGDDLTGFEYCQFYTMEELLAIADRAMGSRESSELNVAVDKSGKDGGRVSKISASRLLRWLRASK